MQFSIVSVIAALAAVTSAQWYNGTSTVVYPTGTSAPTGTVPSSTVGFPGAAPAVTGAGSAMAMLVAAGGAALML